MSQLSS